VSNQDSLLTAVGNVIEAYGGFIAGFNNSRLSYVAADELSMPPSE
jgi:hypothetical protein